jgi:hypothetical protein
MPSSVSPSVLHMGLFLTAHRSLCTQHRNPLGNCALMVSPSYAIMWSSFHLLLTYSFLNCCRFIYKAELEMPRGRNRNTNFLFYRESGRVTQYVTLISFALPPRIDALHRQRGSTGVILHFWSAWKRFQLGILAF